MSVDRRKLLKMLGATCGCAAGMDMAPLGMARGLFSSGVASAQTAYEPGRYIYIQQPGAPARWMFDLLLNPGNQNNFVENTHVATEFVGNTRYEDTRYRLIKVGDTYVPPIWNFDLPAPGGGTRKLRSLLRNMVHIRGIDTGNAGHPFSQKQHYRPLGAKTTMTALTGDASSAPLPALDVGALNYDYESTRSKSSVGLSINSENLINDLMKPFSAAGNQKYRTLLGSMSPELVSARAELDRQMLGHYPENTSLVKADENSRQLRDRDFPNAVTVWENLLSKYEDLIDRALSGTYPRINDKPIGKKGSRGVEYHLDNKVVTNADLRTMIQSSTSIKSMAKSFALAEFAVTYDLSKNIVINPGFITGLNAHQTKQIADEHRTGKMVSLILNTLYYCALGSCLLEFIAVLKSQNKYNDSVIDVAGEFNRRPRTNGSGSDHGFTGASVAMYSGKVSEGPIVIGDIKRDDQGAVYSGTWGEGVANAPLGGAKLNAGHFASTAAMLLGVPSPVTAVTSLLKPKNGKFVSIARQGRIKGGS